MPGSAMAELIFIAAMMIVIMIVSIGAVYFFVKTYRKEMAAKSKQRDEPVGPGVVVREENAQQEPADR